MTVWRLPDRAATARFGEALGRLLFPGAVVALIGEVGAGKTTLTQAIACGMSVSGPVTSPTFGLIHVYHGRVPLFHFDTYRLTSVDQLQDVGFSECFDQGGVVVVEWADLFPDLLPDDLLTIHLSEPNEGLRSIDADGGARIVAVESRGVRHCRLRAELADMDDLKDYLQAP